MDDLVRRGGLYYEKFTATPFAGVLDKGLYRGSIKEGQMGGDWEGYWDNGQLWYKGKFKNYKREGYREYYSYNGSVDKAFTGTYKNGVKVSD